MKLLRFALWNLGIRVCDVIGGPINAFAVAYERRFPDRTCPIYACAIHGWLADGDIPESWWDRFGWGTPA